MEKTILQPTYYSEFKCIAQNCKLNCCNTNWRITTNRDTYKYYKSIQEPKDFAKKLHKYIVRNPHAIDDKHYGMLLQMQNYQFTSSFQKEVPAMACSCEFYTAEGLCEIRKELGYQHLPQECKTFPRLLHEFLDSQELSLSSGCEEVCRMFYEMKDGIQFTQVTYPNFDTTLKLGESISHSSKNTTLLIPHFPDIRMLAIEILQFRQLANFDDRVILLGAFLAKIQILVDTKNFDDIFDTMKNFGSVIHAYEPLYGLDTKRYDIAHNFFLNIGTAHIDMISTAKEKNDMKEWIDNIINCQTEDHYFDEDQYIKILEHRDELLKDSAHFLENIFVNVFFAMQYPANIWKIDPSNVFDAYVQFSGSYAYYKLVIAGCLANEETLDLDRLYRATVLVSRDIIYSHKNLRSIGQFLKQFDLTHVPHMAILTKST